MIDYGKKLTTDRAFYPIDDVDYSVESDRGRVLSSPALRRLQKRTQVFALELNASIRTRLTHSLEVAQTARFIAKSVLRRLDSDGGLERYGLDGLENAFVSTAEVAALLHDIGNPPFGHFGEATIGKFVSEHYVPLLEGVHTASEESDALKAKMIRDIETFEGNAQAIRIVTKLQRLNLSYTQTLAILKYTRGAFEPKPQRDEPLGYIRKKPGFYLSEAEEVKRMQDALDITSGGRFPTVYIMEAADDIAYLTADLEDAVDKGVLRLEEVYRYIVEACETEGETTLKRLVEEQYARAMKDEAPYRFNMFFTLLRARLITQLVGFAADNYVKHHKAVFEGTLDAPLLACEESHELYIAVKILQRVSSEHIYRSKAVQERELQGYRVLQSLLKYYMPLIELDTETMRRLVEGERIDCFVAEPLLKRISQKQVATYLADLRLRQTGDRETDSLWERYLRMRMVLDYISGMTDDYALHEYRLLEARL